MRPLGRAAVLTRILSASPPGSKNRPRRFRFAHAVGKAVRRELWEAYSWVMAAYRKVADRLRTGDREAAFPLGCFPPVLPFVDG